MLRAMPVFVSACLLATMAAAQNRMTAGGHPAGRAHSAPAGAGRTTVRISGGGFEGRRFHRPFRGGGFIGGYGWPYSYDDYGESYEPEQPAQTQPTAAIPAAPLKPEPVPDPVLLELRGSQWVRVDNFTSAPANVQAESPSVLETAAKNSAPAVLIFRDGHSEELSSYSIIGPVIYTKADYWSSGNWTRKIQIADLDLDSTLKQNQDRGVKFELPSGPNEVMIRP